MGRATCVVCGATFSRAMSLRRHALLHATSKERIKHQCHTCGRTFARADGLARHINIHTGNDLEHCEDCGRGFGRGYLDAHIRTCRGHFMRRQDERAGIQPAQNANNVQILDWRIERRKGEELLPQTKTPGLMKPVQFVHETVGSLTTLCKNAEQIVRKNDLRALEELLGCLVLRYATVGAFHQLYDFEIAKWTDRQGPISLLDIAAESGALEVLRYLSSPWQKLADIPNGQAILHRAVRNGHQDVMTFLVRVKSADLNCRIREFENQSPLAVAVDSGNIDIVKHLIDLGCDLQAPCTTSSDPVICLALEHRYNEIAKLLIDQGAPVKVASRFGVTPLHYAARSGELEIIDNLMRSGAVIDAGTTSIKNYGGTPLCWATEAGQVDAMRLLLISGAKVEGLSGRNKDTPLLCACFASLEFGLSALEVLIAWTVDLDRLHQDGGRACTVLSICCRRSWASLEVVQCLVEAGADLNHGDRAPLLDAWQCASVEIFEFLLISGADHTKLDLHEVKPLREEGLEKWPPELANEIPFRDQKMAILNAWKPEC